MSEYQEKSDQTWFIFANQDNTSGHGNSDLNGEWFVTGYFCMPHPLVYNRATLGAFLDRIAAGLLPSLSRHRKRRNRANCRRSRPGRSR
ncbi:MAG: hypothetical protein VX596_01935, partial [Pseudomonadota bacterium]|nr:hypothetical protein [Pseudomonadota bacterium]